MAADDSPFRDRDPIDDDLAVRILDEGDIEILGRMPWSSNATLLTEVHHDDAPDGAVQAIYKPHQGERPLWDFPSGLYKREVACYRLSAALGWDLVPPTVLRDGPVGDGSLQLFIPCDFDEHYLTLKDDLQYRETFERLAIFDVMANSTDRKSGHVLLGHDGEIWAIDNGLSFHHEFKLRTVLWDYADDRLPLDALDELNAFVKAGLPDELDELLDPFEADAVIARTRALINEGRFPTDPTGRRWPWPIV